MMYLVINPYGPAYGVRTYSHNLVARLGGGFEVAVLSNDENLSFPAFRDFVRAEVTARHHPDAVVIEAPEARAATLHLPAEYRLHIRLHAPGAVGRLSSGVPVDTARHADELAVIERASALSTPTFAMAAQLCAHVDSRAVHVFKNPPDTTIRARAVGEKDIDLFFMGRFDRAKGSDWLNPLLRRLEADARAMLIGPGGPDFAVAPDVRCRVDRHGPIADDSRFDLLARAKVAVVPSRFENCSMAIIEALAAGTVVVCWDVGGNAEIAPPPLLRLAPLGDLERFAAAVDDARRAPYPSPAAFTAATQALADDFDAGWQRLWAELGGVGGGVRYSGLNHRPAHLAGNPELAPEPPRLTLPAPARPHVA